jgi:flagellar assembly protein FliH
VASFTSLLTPMASLPEKRGRTNMREAAIEIGRQQGYEEGFQQGHDEGYRRGLEEGFFAAQAEAQPHFQKAVREFPAILAAQNEAIDQALQDWTQATEASLTKLALAIAARALGDELRTQPESLARFVSSALAEVTNARAARVRVNPAAVEALQPYVDALCSTGSSLRHIELVRDSSVGLGCLVESDGGVIDARVDQMLQVALDELRRSE